MRPTSGVSTDDPPFISFALDPEVGLEIQVFADDTGIGGAPFKARCCIDEPVWPDRLIGKDQVVLVQEDEVDVAVAQSGKLGEDVKLSLLQGSICGNDGQVQITSRAGLSGGLRAEQVHRLNLRIAFEDSRKLLKFKRFQRFICPHISFSETRI